MLIESPRHTKADKDLWQALENTDRAYGEFVGREGRRIECLFVEASNALIAFRLMSTRVYCGVSWGKDSVVVAYILRCVWPEVPLVHLRPTNHNPDSNAVRDEYFRRFPGQIYHEIPVDYGNLHADLAGEDLDKATDKIWNRAWSDCRKRFGERHISGVRAKESKTRAIRMGRWGINSKNASAPIGWWTAEDVFAYLAINNLPVHPVYGCLGGGRWERDRLRVAEIGDTHGTGGGRREWEQEYYGDVLRRLNSRGKS